MMKNSLAVLSMLALTSVVGGKGVFDIGSDRQMDPIDFDELSEEEKKRYMEKHIREKQKAEKQLAEAKGLKEFEFYVNGQRHFVYAINEKNRCRKIRLKLLAILKEYGENGLEYPHFYVDKSVSIAGVRKAYEVGRSKFKPV
jgi:hypothetical protein